MSKEDVINYVMTTPNNPNRAVLEGMLDEIEKGGAMEASYIQLGTIENAISSELGNNTMRRISGNLYYQDESLYDKIGDKTIIGYMIAYTGQGSRIWQSTLVTAYRVSLKDSALTLQDIPIEERANVTMIGVDGFGDTNGEATLSIDIYALCI